MERKYDIRNNDWFTKVKRMIRRPTRERNGRFVNLFIYHMTMVVINPPNFRDFEKDGKVKS